MSYKSIELRAKTLLEGVTNYLQAGRVTLGNYGVLDDGFDYCAVLRPGTVSTQGTASFETTWTYDILIDLFERWQDDVSALDLFGSFRDAVILHMNQYPSLNGGDAVLLQGFTTDGDPQDVNDENGNGPFFLMQRLRLTVVERIYETGGEYA